MAKNNLHMGKEVEKVFRASGLTADELAKRLGWSHSNPYAKYKKESLDYEDLKRFSEALNHDFMYLLGVDNDTAEDTKEDIKEQIPSMHFYTDAVDDDTFGTIVRDYVSGDFVKPLVVLAYNCGTEARKIAYNASRKVHGVMVSRNTTDLMSLKYTPHKVYIFSESSLKEKVEDVDIFLGKIIEANNKAGKYVIYIIDIPRYNLDSIEEYNKLENFLRQKHLLWGNRVHTLCFDSTQALYKRRNELSVVNGTKYTFDASLFTCEGELSEEEKQLIDHDPYSILYSEDGKRLLHAPSASDVFQVKEGTEIICDEAFKDNVMIKKVILPQSIRIIGRIAFSGCKELLQIYMPERMEAIGDECFGDCESLSKVVMPKDLKCIGNYAFKYCSSLKSIDLPPTLVTISKFAFQHSGLTSITITKEERPDKDVCVVETGAFADCTNLKTAVIGSYVSLEGADVFSDCISLTDVTLQGHRANAGELVGGLSVHCPSLEVVTYKLR